MDDAIQTAAAGDALSPDQGRLLTALSSVLSVEEQRQAWSIAIEALNCVNQGKTLGMIVEVVAYLLASAMAEMAARCTEDFDSTSLVRNLTTYVPLRAREIIFDGGQPRH